MLQIRCIRCGGPHLVWECKEPKADKAENYPEAKRSVRFDKTAYQREYMRKRRAAAKGENG